MTRQLRFTVLALGALLLISSLPSSAQPSAADILKKSYAAESSRAFSGQLKTTLYLQGVSTSAEVNVLRSGRRSRMSYVTGPSKGTAIIDDGKTLIRLVPSDKTAYISNTPEAPEHLDLLLVNHTPTILGSAKTAGKDCYVLRISPKHPGNPSKKLWIDKSTFVALKTERYGSDGKLAMSTEYTKVDFAVRPASSQFAVPSGWKTVRLAAETSNGSLDSVRKTVGFTPVKPGYVPKGYSLDGYYVREAPSQVRFAGLRYTNGMNVISIFQRREAGRGPGFGMQRGRGGQGRGMGPGPCMTGGNSHARMISTTAGGLIITVVGDIADSELQKIAASFK